MIANDYILHLEKMKETIANYLVNPTIGINTIIQIYHYYQTILSF